MRTSNLALLVASLIGVTSPAFAQPQTAGTSTAQTQGSTTPRTTPAPALVSVTPEAISPRIQTPAKPAATPTEAPAAHPSQAQIVAKPATPSGQAQTPIKPATAAFVPAWAALIGEWTGEGAGQPGAGQGTFSFKFDLDGRVIVRKNHTEIAPSGTKPASMHDDWLIVYPTERTIESRALYVDNEGHVINYRARWSQDARKLTLQSDVVTGQPRFRLTYTLVSASEVTIGFEMAPPGSPDGFKPYLTGKAKKQ